MNRETIAAQTPHRFGRGLPPIARDLLLVILGSGLLLVAAGAAVDIAHHAGVARLAAESMGTAGHLVTLAGMLLTTLALALLAIVRRR